MPARHRGIEPLHNREQVERARAREAMKTLQILKKGWRLAKFCRCCEGIIARAKLLAR